MATDARGSFWALKPHDNLNRSHVPAQPMWHFYLRIAQFALAIIVVALTGYAADKFNVTFNSLAYSFFVFAWTLLFLGWLLISLFFFPVAYHPFAHIAAEAMTVIFWLACWADLASDASSLGKYEDYVDGYFGYYGELKRAIDCVKAAAGIGALEWVLFVVTLVFYVLSFLKHHKTQSGTGAVVGEPKTNPVAPVEMAPVAGQHQQQPEYYPQQQPVHSHEQPYPTQEQPYQQQQPGHQTQPYQSV